jgi:carbon monoxide dehydrogenase subunit G
LGVNGCRMIEVDERFEVPAPPPAVWSVLADPYAVVGCVPGAAIVSRADDGALETTLTVKFGPLSVVFQARAVLDLNHDQMRGQLSARGRDKQGGARFLASAAFNVTPVELGSIVATHGGVDISGRLASVIEGGADLVVKRMSAQFADCLRARLAD